MKALPVISLAHGLHYKDTRILVGFEYNEDLIAIIKQVPSARWSATMKSWHMPNTRETIVALTEAFEHRATVDRSNINFSMKPPGKNSMVKGNRQLTGDQRTVLNRFVIYLRGKRYSESTVRVYSSLMADFIEYHKDRPLHTLGKRDVEGFAENFLVPRNYSISTHRQFISAMKLFIIFYPDTQIEGLELERPKRSKRLPTVLSSEEVIDLLRCTKNLKHRAILGLIYSAGLRISELLNLELRHIDIDRRQLLIKNAKGRKDRYVVLSEGLMPLLSNYLMTYTPKRYFVEGRDGGPYTASSIRKFLSRSCRVAKIHKHVTPHTLRHSYATHLLEHGVGVRHIQELLGHSKPETTMIYTHVVKKDLLEIRSPLDRILLSLSKTQKQEQHILLSGNNTI